MNWKVWLQGLAAAVIGGAATSATHILAEGAVQPKQIAIGAGMGALVTGLAYLMKSPIASDSAAPPKE
jgi:ABC-type uncharacterized transport system permease subunit